MAKGVDIFLKGEMGAFQAMITVVFTFAATVSADGLHLLDHARSQLSDHDAHTAPSACRALLDSTRLPTLATSWKHT